MADEPCEPWATVEDLEACEGCDTADLSDEAIDDGLRIASSWLYRLTGRLFPGACTTIVRPVWECGCPGLSDGWLIINSRGGQIEFLPRVFSRSGRARESVREIYLGFEPIISISEILIDGAPFADFRIDDDAWLFVRTDGQGWPRQDLQLASSEEGTFSVEFVYGQPPPFDGFVAARELGLEVAKAICRKDCALPARAQSVARQGLTIQLTDPTQLLADGRFGIMLVDAFLTSINPQNLGEGASITNVDQMRAVRRVGAPPGS